jgi:hypothetical protein
MTRATPSRPIRAGASASHASRLVGPPHATAARTGRSCDT